MRRNTIWRATRRFCQSACEASSLREGFKKYVFVQPCSTDQAVQTRAEELSSRLDLSLLPSSDQSDQTPRPGLNSFGVLQVQPTRLQFCYFITRWLFFVGLSREGDYLIRERDRKESFGLRTDHSAGCVLHGHARIFQKQCTPPTP